MECSVIKLRKNYNFLFRNITVPIHSELGAEHILPQIITAPHISVPQIILQEDIIDYKPMKYIIESIFE